MGGTPPSGSGGRGGPRSGSGRWGPLAIIRGQPWLKAPLLLLRYPGILLALGTAVVILAVAGASSPLFLSSAGTASLQGGVAATCPWEVGIKLSTNAPLAGPALGQGLVESGPRVSALSAYRSFDEDFRRRMGKGLDHVGVVVGDASSSVTQATNGGAKSGESVGVRLYTRDGGLDHVEKLASAGGEGVWIPDTVASLLVLRPGQTINFSGSLARFDTKAKARVAGVYRDLVSQPRTPYWCAQEHLIYPLSAFSNSNPPPLVMADRDTFIRLAKKLGERDATFTYDLPVLAEHLTLADAHTLSAGLEASKADLGPGNPFGGPGVFFGVIHRTSTLPFLVSDADDTVTSLRRSVDTISLAGRLVALVVIAASGVYWVTRRRAEVVLLSARGIGAVGIGAKVLLECLPVAAVGAAVGWALGVWLAKTLGPTDLLDPQAPSAALRQVVWTTAVGVVFLALVAAVAARRETEGGPTRGREALARAPWELAVLALAGASLYEILTRGTRPVQTTGGPAKLDVLVLLFPILFVAGAAGLAVRILGRVLPSVRRARQSRSHALYLASRRVAAAPRIALSLVTATALAIGILIYAGTLTRSVSATSDAKALVFTGSDVAVTVAEDVSVPAALRGKATVVKVIESGYLLPDQQPLNILGVDRSTFADAAFWDPSFARKSLPALLDDLTPPTDPGRPLPMLVAGGGLPGTGTLVFRGGPARIPVRVADVLKAFPGMSPGRPIVVVDQQAMEARGARGFSVIWSTADPDSVQKALPSGTHVLAFATASKVQRSPDFLSLSWALGFLQALGVMAGLIVIGGILLYLEARQRAREVSFALARRMGLTSGAHRRSVALELGGMLGLGAALGAALAWIAARIVYGQIDPLPQIPPPPLFRTPVELLLLTGVALLLAAWAGAWRVQRAAERARVGEVMRLAG